MCLIAVAHQVHSQYPLLLAANRDEFLSRPTVAMHWWPTSEQNPHTMLAGQDLVAGGTWFGMDTKGRWAAVTNIRKPDPRNNSQPRLSRGALCTKFLHGDQSAMSYAQCLRGQDYAGFNLLLWDGDALIYTSSEQNQPRVLMPGIYGLSNALLNTPWPKVEKVKRAISQTPVSAKPLGVHDHLQGFMRDTQLAADQDLPQTGISHDWEKRLSACFIEATDLNYGTRTCISVIRDSSHQSSIVAREFEGEKLAQRQFLVVPSA